MYLGILEADTIKQAKMMETIEKECYEQENLSKQGLQQKSHQRDKHLAKG